MAETIKSIKDKVQGLVKDNHFQLIVGVINMLGWHHTEPGGKNADLPDGRRRALEQARKWIIGRCLVVMAVEVERIQAAAIEAAGEFKYVMVRPNNVNVGRAGNWLGNVIFYRYRWVKLLETRNINAPLRGRAKGLNAPVARFKIRWLPIYFWVICFHFPRVNGPLIDTEDAIACRKAFMREFRDFAQQVNDPILCGGDGNSGNLSLYDEGENVGVEWLFVKRAEIAGVMEEDLGKPWADHPHWLRALVPLEVGVKLRGRDKGGRIGMGRRLR